MTSHEQQALEDSQRPGNGQF